MIDKKNPIIINEFNKGIADSPLTGFADMRNVDISKLKGVVQCGQETEVYSQDYTDSNFDDQTFTAATTDIVTFTDHNYKWDVYTGYGIPVQFTTTGALPAGLAVDTTYFLDYIDSASETNNQYKLSATWDDLGTTNIDITDTGTGTHTASVVKFEEPQEETVDSSGNNYIGDDNGNVWKIRQPMQYYPGNDNNATRGIVAWKGYIFHFTGTNIDVLDVSAETWSNDWQSVTSEFNHKAIVGRDDRVYFCNEHTVGRIIENSGETFDPTDSDTYTYTTNALTIPDSDDVDYLAELGDKLVVISDQGRIYFWDRTSNSFDAPLQHTESIDVAIDANNLLYFAGGDKGRIYITDGTSVKLINQIPEHLTDSSINFTSINRIDDEILFAVSNNDVGGIWSLNINTGVLIMRNKLTNGYDASNIGVISSDITSSGFYVAYETGDDSVVEVSSTAEYDGYESYLVSPYYIVGTLTKPRTFNKIEVEFVEKLYSSDGFKIYYREDLGSSWTLLVSDTGDNPAVKKSFDFPILLDVEAIQFKIELDTANSTPNTKTQLKEIRIL